MGALEAMAHHHHRGGLPPALRIQAPPGCSARSLGRSMRIFKSEVDEMKAEHEQSKASRATVEGEKIERAADDATDTVNPVTERNDRSA